MDKRLLLFVTLAVMLFLGWIGLQAWLLPAKPKPANVEKVVAALKGEEGHALAAWLAAPPVPFKFEIAPLVVGPNLDWKLTRKSKDELVFEATVPGKDIQVTKTYRLKPGHYHVDMELAFKKSSAGKDDFVYELTGPHGLPVEGQAWRQEPYR